MTPYHKIKTLWSRDPLTKYRTLIKGEWACPEFAYLKDNNWNWYEKVDGTNIRVIFNPASQVEFRGRTDRADIPKHLLQVLTEQFTTQFFEDNFDLGKSLLSTITLYGEGFGPKIQKGGGNYGDSVDFCLFDVMIGDIWMTQEFVDDLAKSSGLQRAPLLWDGTLEQAITQTKVGFWSKWGKFQAEGLIVRPQVDLFTRTGARIIGKIKTKDFE